MIVKKDETDYNNQKKDYAGSDCMSNNTEKQIVKTYKKVLKKYLERREKEALDVQWTSV